MRNFIYICLLLLVSAPTVAKPLLLTDDISIISAIPFLSVLEDPGQQFTVEQVVSEKMSGKFKPYSDSGELKSLGFRDSAWWLKLDIQNDTQQTHWYSRFTIPINAAESDIYFTTDKQQKPIPLLPIKGENSRLPPDTFKLPNANQFSLILRLNNQGKAFVFAPLQLLNEEQLYQKTTVKYFLYGGIITVVFVLAIYNLFIFFSLREPAYLTLGIFLLASLFMLQRTTGVVPFLYFMNDPTTLYYSFFYQVLLISGFQFWRQMTNSKVLLPTQDKIFQYLLFMLISITPFISLLPYPRLWPVYLSIPLFGIIIFFSIKVWKKHRLMFSFSLAYLTMILSAMPVTLTSLNIFFDKFGLALDIYNIGILFASVLVSFSLAEHSHQLRKQVDQANIENAAKERFLTTMSHELRTPMHTANSIISLLKHSPNDAQQKDYLNKLETSNNHMLALINNILDLARSKSNELQLENQPFKLNDILSELEALITDEAIRKELTFTISNDYSTTDELLVGDELRLKQVLLNLLSNALKFTEKGEIILSISPLKNNTEQTQTLQFIVTDTGIGIPDAQKKHLFEAFSQLDSSTTRKYGGSGLGLSISSQLIQNMGGKLELDSKQNQGCQFYFTLTFATKPIPQPVSPQEDPFTHQVPDNIRLLLVEDDPLNAMLGETQLNIMGFICTIADSGESALEVLKDHEVDLVLMDISMPGLNGYQTSQKIRSDLKLTELPIVALTAHRIEGEKERCLEAGMNDYLSKPFDPSELKEKVLFWIEQP